jgi:hypothetical protein
MMHVRMILYIFGISSERIVKTGIVIIFLQLLICQAGFSLEDESSDTTATENPDPMPAALSDTTDTMPAALSDTTDTMPAALSDTLDTIPDRRPLSPMEGIGDYRITVQPDTSASLEGDRSFNLIRAADNGQLEIVKFLVEKGVDVDAATVEGVTPLMYASQNGYTEIMEYLIGHGADVNATPDNGVTPLLGAVRMGHYDAVKMQKMNWTLLH